VIGISGAAIYVPRFRVPREVISISWGKSPVPGSKAVCHFDEDTLTMGYSAANLLTATGTEPDRLLFASTSAPYWQRSAASQIAAACDLRPGTETMDFGSSLRCGTSALVTAIEAVQAGQVNHVLVAAAERREAAPESADELLFGDSAAAITISREGVMAELVATHSRSDDFLDEWRRDRDTYVQSYPSKYSLSRGYEANVVSVTKELLAKAGVDADAITVAALACPDGRAQATCAKAIGIGLSGLVDMNLAEIGNTGSAMPLLGLALGLEKAQPGDLILCVGYGDGADALLFRALSPGARILRDSKTIKVATYPLFRKSRDYLREGSGDAEISNVLWKREAQQNVRLHGTKCPVCCRVQFPITRICSACRNPQGLQEVPLARTGSVFTFTKDFLYDAPVQPTVMAVVDLDRGGRFLCQMTDADEREVRIGMRVELVLRRMREGPANHHYYWKCRPAEGAS
jgi:hydroxymethylglutaryl-CoA synthase